MILLTRGQVTDMGAFIKAQRQREDLNRTQGLRGDTDDEDELGRFDIGDAPPTDRRSTLLPLALSPSITTANPTTNSNPNSCASEKGVRIEKITTLKHSKDYRLLYYRSYLRHYYPTLPIRLETDASNAALAGILSQLFEDGWHPIAFFSQKFNRN